MENIKDEVSKYYNEKIKEHGASSKGVDWNGIESHNLRFEQLTKIIEADASSIIDYGCGYGAIIDYLDTKYKNFRYTGFDIASEMIDAGNKKYANRNNISFHQKLDTIKKHDYCIASGIFNVRLKNNDADWEAYIIATLHEMNNICTKGFSFNILTSYSDKEYMRDYLYYAKPDWLFDYCKRNFSKKIALLHDYELYEFTILVRK
ncbi:MAG: hypothetical protein RL708_297 [Bacteroidota bacterium]|jgi:SAM-dependent methyltransferase